MSEKQAGTTTANAELIRQEAMGILEDLRALQGSLKPVLAKGAPDEGPASTKIDTSCPLADNLSNSLKCLRESKHLLTQLRKNLRV